MGAWEKSIPGRHTAQEKAEKKSTMRWLSSPMVPSFRTKV